MNIEYATVVDPLTLVPSALAMVIHFSAAITQGALTLFLVASGLRGLLRPSGARPMSAIRLPLGLLLLLPLLLGVAALVSLAAAVASVAMLIYLERKNAKGNDRPACFFSRRLPRRLVLTALITLCLFMAWEREDPLALAAEIGQNMSYWRAHEVAWQRRNDSRAPKVGELAPDFELQDPDGLKAVRLSDFRGKRPVALVFGSYT